jgi:hypothetical protein
VYVVSVLASEQKLAGGWLQVTPTQGSPLHAPLAQPLAQAFLLDE